MCKAYKIQQECGKTIEQDDDVSTQHKQRDKEGERERERDVFHRGQYFMRD